MKEIKPAPTQLKNVLRQGGIDGLILRGQRPIGSSSKTPRKRRVVVKKKK